LAIRTNSRSNSRLDARLTRSSAGLCYTHIFVRDASFNISPGVNNPVFDPGLGTFIGTSSAAADIVSVGLRYHFVPVAPRDASGEPSEARQMLHPTPQS
jgi:hypothetical protein